MNTEKKIFFGSFVGFMILLGIAVLSGSVAIGTNLLFAGVIVLTAPFSIYKYFEFKRTKEFERLFPNFLRDVAESQRAGLTFVQALNVAAKSDYGILSKEIKKMDNQISWNITLDKVLRSFARRMGKSNIIVRSLMIIDQANKSGGNIEDTMDSLAGNIELLRDVEEEKKTLLNQQVMMMYAIFFMFLGITIALLKFLVPLIQTQTVGGVPGQASFFEGFGANPCKPCVASVDPACIGCGAMFVVSESFAFGSVNDPASYYRSLFFIMIIVQGFFTGLIAGQIGSDSIAAGVKHSLIFLISGFSVFLILVGFNVI